MFPSQRTPEGPEGNAPPANPKSLRFTDTTGKIPERLVPVLSASATPSFSPDGEYAAILSVDQEGDLATALELKVWNLATNREVLTRRLPAKEQAAPFGPGFARPADSAPVPRGSRRTFAGTLTLPVFTADSTRVATIIHEGQAGSSEARLHVWNVKTGKELVSEPQAMVHLVTGVVECHGELLINMPRAVPAGLLAAARRATDGSRIATSGALLPGTGVQVWHLATGKLVWSDERPAMAWVSPDGAVVAGMSSGIAAASEFVIWKMASGEQISVLPVPSDFMALSVAFLDAGRILAVAHGPVVTCYDIATGTQRAELRGHQGNIVAIGSSKNGNRLATATAPAMAPSGFGGPGGPLLEINEIKVWDTATGQELASLPGFPRRGGTGFFTGSRSSLSTLEVNNHQVRLSEDRIREIEPLSADAAARECAHWLNSVVGSEGVLSRAQIDEYLAADKSLDDAARALAIQYTSSRRNPFDLVQNAAADLKRSDAAPSQYERALALVQEANEHTKSGVQALDLEALAHYRLGNFTAALAVAQRSIQAATQRQDSPRSEDFTILALVQHQLGQTAEALQSLERARGVASRDETHWRGLLAEAETKLAIPPADATPDRWVGRRFMTRTNQRVTDEAGRPTSGYVVPFYISRVEGNRLGFGKYLIERIDVVPLEDAVAYYTSALELNPTNTSLLGNRGIAWRALGERAKAIEDYTAAIRLSPTNAAPLASRGRVYGYELDEFEKALADFDASLKLQPVNAHTLENRGEMLWRLGRIDEALETLNQAIRLDPNRCEAYGVRAQVWSAKGDREKMRQDLEESIRRHPEDRFAWSLRAWALATSPVAEHRDGKLAVAAATRACELTFWKDAHCLDILAAAHAEAESFSQAVKWAEQAVTLAHTHNRVKYELRLALYRAGKPYRETQTVKP